MPAAGGKDGRKRQAGRVHGRAEGGLDLENLAPVYEISQIGAGVVVPALLWAQLARGRYGWPVAGSRMDSHGPMDHPEIRLTCQC